MRNPKLQLLKALIPDIVSRVGYNRVYTKVPKSVTYPYVLVGDIFMDEDGPKNRFWYNPDVQVQIVYANETSIVNRLSDSNAIMGLINNTTPFALTDNFKIQAVTLVNESETEIVIESSLITQVTIIRMLFNIEDLQ